MKGRSRREEEEGKRQTAGGMEGFGMHPDLDVPGRWLATAGVALETRLRGLEYY